MSGGPGVSIAGIAAAVEAAAPHIIEQFIDGLTWEKVNDAIHAAMRQRGFPDKPCANDAIQAELKRLIPTPEGKKDD